MSNDQSQAKSSARAPSAGRKPQLPTAQICPMFMQMFTVTSEQITNAQGVTEVEKTLVSNRLQHKRDQLDYQKDYQKDFLSHQKSVNQVAIEHMRQELALKPKTTEELHEHSIYMALSAINHGHVPREQVGPVIAMLSYPVRVSALNPPSVPVSVPVPQPVADPSAAMPQQAPLTDMEDSETETDEDHPVPDGAESPASIRSRSTPSGTRRRNADGPEEKYPDPNEPSPQKRQRSCRRQVVFTSLCFLFSAVLFGFILV